MKNICERLLLVVDAEPATLLKINSDFDIHDTNGIKLLSRLGDKQNVYWGYLYLTNLNVVKSAELIQIRHCRIGKAIKTKF